MSERLRVVVTGLAATYPFGGVFWDYLQYPLGLRRLGHEVLYVEDTGQWCYDPAAATFVPGGARNAAALARRIARLDAGLRGRWFFRDALGHDFGCPWDEVAAFCRGSDLFLHLSAASLQREEYLAAGRVAFIDTDPMYTQASVPAYLDGSIDDAARTRLEAMLRHDVFFTFGENVGASDCRIPSDLFHWRPTRQPVVLERFAEAAVPVRARRRALTTVASWEPSERDLVVGGVRYGGKGSELERFLRLPARSALPLELALSGRVPAWRLRAHGWVLLDANAVSRDPWIYRDHLAGATAEWSVAKEAYVASRSGWFSCRTACFLALGVPAVVQDTGFRGHLPTGEGLLAFTDMEEAVEAIARVAAEPERHAAAARAIAEEHFDSDRVLGALIEEALR